MPFPKIIFVLRRFIVATQCIRTKPADINQPNVSNFWHFRIVNVFNLARCVFSSGRSRRTPRSRCSIPYSPNRSRMTHFASGTACVFSLNRVFDAKNNCMRRDSWDFMCLYFSYPLERPINSFPRKCRRSRNFESTLRLVLPKTTQPRAQIQLMHSGRTEPRAQTQVSMRSDQIPHGFNLLVPPSWGRVAWGVRHTRTCARNGCCATRCSFATCTRT